MTEREAIQIIKDENLKNYNLQPKEKVYMQKIMEDGGIELYKDNSKYYLRYDSGELMIKMKNLEIPAGEAKNVVNNTDSAYNIILAYHDKGIYGEDSEIKLFSKHFRGQSRKVNFQAPTEAMQLGLLFLPRMSDGRIDMPALFAAYSQGKTSAADFSAAMKENAQISGALVRNNEKQAQDAALRPTYTMNCI